MINNIFVVIVSYNGIKWIEKCLLSIKENNCENIIVVDNCSTDGTVEFVKNNFQHVHLIEAKSNLGFGRANNLGIKYALEHKADYVFLLNQDVYVHNGAILELIKCFEANSEFGILSPIHLNGIGTAFDYNFSYYLSPDKCKDFYSDL